MHHTSRQHNARIVLHIVSGHEEPISSCLSAQLHLPYRSFSAASYQSPVQFTHLISTAARCEISVGRSSPSYHLTGTVTDTLCPVGPAQTQNPSFIMLPAHNFSRVTPCTFLPLLLSQGCDCPFFSTEACRPPCFVLAPSHRDSYPVSRRFARLLRNRVHATNKSRDCCLLLFPLLQQSKKV
jgi:hypothetical protein